MIEALAAAAPAPGSATGSSSPSHGEEHGGVKQIGAGAFVPTAHLITAVIGSGVLSLAWATAQLGWVAVPVAVLLFAGFTYCVSTLLLGSLHSVDDSSGTRRRNSTYTEALQRHNSGRLFTFLCGLLQYCCLVGATWGHTASSIISMMSFLNLFLKGKFGRTVATAFLFILQVVLSQAVPGLDQMWWISPMAVVASISTTMICCCLGLARVAANKTWGGHVTGVVAGLTPRDRAWRCVLVLGDVAFAYAPVCHLLLEIASTLHAAATSEKKVMRRATQYGAVVVTTSYMICSVTGYAAFGEATPENLLVDGYNTPSWLVGFAIGSQLSYLICAYQLYCQVLFAAAEKWARMRWPEVMNMEVEVRCCRLNLFRLVSRTSYVAAATAVSVFLPHLESFLRVVSALAYWPLLVYQPIEMYMVRKKVPAWSHRGVLLKMLNLIGFAFAMATIVASVVELISAFKS